ncbi:MAG TPA: SDR family oxidoreductase [Bacteroidota bacterium]
MRTVLVTGATGFLGSNLTAALVRQGLHVRILRRASSELRALESADVEHRVGDVLDKQSVLNAVRGCDTVFHAAALVSYWKRQRAQLFATNVDGTRNVVEACLELGVGKLVHTSSVAAIGFPSGKAPADESTVFNWEPYDVGYRISKHRAEQEVLRGVKLGLPAVIVNPSVIIGERDIHFNGGQIVRDVYRKRLFYYVQGGISVAYVGDIVHGHLMAARQGRSGERYILSGENLTHKQLLSVTAEVVGGLKPAVKLPMWFAKGLAAVSETIGNVSNTKPWIARELVAGLDLICWFSCEKAKRELGYSVTPFRTAVQRTFEWYKRNSLL